MILQEEERLRHPLSPFAIEKACLFLSGCGKSLLLSLGKGELEGGK
jgi:hypothetical protein